MPLTTTQLAPIKERDPYLYECILKIIAEINLTQQQTGVAGSSSLVAPPVIGSLSVVAANGFFDIAVADKSVAQRGIVYFAEFDTSPDFTNAHVIPMHTSRNHHIGLGNLTTYWRAYSMYIGSSLRSAMVTYGNPPIAVVGGGAAGPTPQGAQGSGTAQVAGYGYGPPPARRAGPPGRSFL